jgi:LysR family transcriptional regulator, regulator for bpeEF and oprC
MDRFDAMRAFTRVVELNSFTKASTSLNVPPSTLSAQIIALEQRLNVKLLNRTTRHVSVTSEGAAFYDRTIRLLHELEETEASLARLAATPKGRLRIVMPNSLGRHVIVPALGDFFKRYPDIELEVGCTDRHVDLLQEGVDCVVRMGAVIDESLVARPLGHVRMVTCASPQYLKEFGTPLTPEDIERHYVVNYVSPQRKIVPLEFVNGSDTLSVLGQRRMTVDDFVSHARAAVAGIGIAQLPECIASDYLAAGKLQAVLANYSSEKIALYILYPRNRRLSAKLRVFVEWATELFANATFVESPAGPLRR